VCRPASQHTAPLNSTWPTTTRQSARLRESIAGTQLSLIDVRFDVPWPCSRADVEAAATALVARHPALRGEFVRDGDDWAVLVHEPGPVQVSYHEEEVLRPPDFESTQLAGLTPPLIWFHATESDDGTRVALLTEHSVGDGDSVEVLVRDFLLLLAREGGRAGVELPELGRTFGEFAAEERSVLGTAKLGAARDVWAAMFDGVPVTQGVPPSHWSPGLAGELVAQRLALTGPDLQSLDRARKDFQGYPSEPTSFRQGVSRQGRLAWGRSKLGG